MLAGVTCLPLRPDRLHRLDPFPHQRQPRPRVGAVVAHLLPVPAGAHDHQADPAADTELPRCRCGGSESDEQVEAVPVLRRQPALARPRVHTRHRDVRVLGEEQRLLTALLDHAGKRPGPDPVVGGKITDAELDSQTLAGLTTQLHEAANKLKVRVNGRRKRFILWMKCANSYRVSSVASVGDVSSRECVLVVDDDPAVRRLIAGTLASAGYRVVTVVLRG
jgi:hypothetical protein